QPIAIKNVIQFLSRVILFEPSFDKSFDIGGPDILTYKQMLLVFAEIRGMKRYIYTLPIMTPRLSSYWLYFVTSTSYKLATKLVQSMKTEILCTPNNLRDLLNIKIYTYKESVEFAFDKIEQKEVLSSWTDALSGDKLKKGVNKLMILPTYGCLTDVRKQKVEDVQVSLDKICSIGGTNGWYSSNFLWELRGLIDKALGGVGLRRGRKNQNTIKAGETLDFWRVIYISREEKRMLLYAEMKLPGEAWLEFKIVDDVFIQTATFRPRGLIGRLYWYSLLPLHHIVFERMSKRIAKK
ncbi:SDR family oxidoreductase, partial [Aureispira]|nr:SDR family oxidoreductase [Aureispira sp.]